MNDKKRVDYETILLILDYWFADWKKNNGKMPPELKKKMTEEEFDKYATQIHNSFGNISGRYDKLRGEVLERIKIQNDIKLMKENQKLLDEQKEILKKNNELIEKQNRISDGQFNLNVWVAIIFGLTLIVSIYALSNAVSIGTKQIELIEEQLKLIPNQLSSISPLKPKLEISLHDPDDGVIFVENIAKIINDSTSGSQSFNMREITFIISNVGRMQTGRINADLESHFTYSNGGFIENIIGESSDYLKFNIWYNECQRYRKIEYENGTVIYSVPEECDHEVGRVSQGWEDFNLTIDCPLCLENQTRKFLVKLCIYGDVDIDNCLNNVPDSSISEYQIF